MNTLGRIEKYLDSHRERISIAMLVALVALYVLLGSTPAGAKSVDFNRGLAAPYMAAPLAPHHPHWVPAGANPNIRYYYFPSLEVYYDSFVGQFVVFQGGSWVFCRSLPSTYAHISLGSTPLIMLSFNVYRPWHRHEYYVTHYRGFVPPGWSKKGYGDWHCYDENNHGFYTSSHRWVKGPGSPWAGNPGKGNFKPGPGKPSHPVTHGPGGGGTWSKGNGGQKMPAYGHGPKMNAGPSKSPGYGHGPKMGPGPSKVGSNGYGGKMNGATGPKPGNGHGGGYAGPKGGGHGKGGGH